MRWSTSPPRLDTNCRSEREDLGEVLEDASLGDVWYSGILGGVPAQP